MQSKFPKKYGITLDDYTVMHDEQGSVCAVCEKPETTVDGLSGKVKLMAVDHCHVTGKVRGLLCSSCNRGLGFFCDDPALLKRATAYLTKG